MHDIYFKLMYIKGTRPENGSFVEIAEDSRNGTEIFCQFSGSPLTTTANGADRYIRWFLNEVQIDFEQDSQFFGVQFSVVNVTADQVVSSNLTVFADMFDVPLFDGNITCLPPAEVEGSDIFGLFRTMVIPRIGKFISINVVMLMNNIHVRITSKLKNNATLNLYSDSWLGNAYICCGRESREFQCLCCGYKLDS